MRFINVIKECCATLILNVLHWCLEEALAGRLHRGYGVRNARERAAAMLGIGRRTLYNVERNTEGFHPANAPNTRDRGLDVPLEDVALIRPAINKMIINRIPRRLDTILANIKIDNPIWKWSRSALYEAMKSIGITFRTRRHWHYEVMREDEANSLRRAKYLSYFFKYEEEGRSFDFFLSIMAQSEHG
jgi:hypothetical protein